MSPFLITLLFILLVVIWTMGFLHMRRVPKKEHGKLSYERSRDRTKLYWSTLAATWVVTVVLLKEILPVKLSTILGINDDIVSFLFIALPALTFIIYALSHLESHWYKNISKSSKSLRRNTFYWFGLPLLYASLYTYWVLFFVTWIFIIMAMKKIML